MRTYIALLRGINVSGQKIIKMEVLRHVLGELDFSNISTYIQSGNIIFKSSETSQNKLETQIAAKIKEHFNFDVPVVIVTPDDLNQVVRQNPYSDRELADPAQPYVAFLSEEPKAENVAVLKAFDLGKDEFKIIGKSIYLLYANSAGNTKLTNAAIENKLKVKATSRNWKTIHKLIELSKKNDA